MSYVFADTGAAPSRTWGFRKVCSGEQSMGIRARTRPERYPDARAPSAHKFLHRTPSQVLAGARTVELASGDRAPGHSLGPPRPVTMGSRTGLGDVEPHPHRRAEQTDRAPGRAEQPDRAPGRAEQAGPAPGRAEQTDPGWAGQTGNSSPRANSAVPVSAHSILTRSVWVSELSQASGYLSDPVPAQPPIPAAACATAVTFPALAPGPEALDSAPGTAPVYAQPPLAG